MRLEDILGILVGQEIVPSLNTNPERMAHMLRNMDREEDRESSIAYFDSLGLGNVLQEEPFELPMKIPRYLSVITDYHIKEAQHAAAKRLSQAKALCPIRFIEKLAARNEYNRIHSERGRYEIAKGILIDFFRHSLLFEQIEDFHTDMMIGKVRTDGSNEGVAKAFIDYVAREVSPDQMPKFYIRKR